MYVEEHIYTPTLIGAKPVRASHHLFEHDNSPVHSTASTVMPSAVIARALRMGYCCSLCCSVWCHMCCSVCCSANGLNSVESVVRARALRIRDCCSGAGHVSVCVELCSLFDTHWNTSGNVCVAHTLQDVFQCVWRRPTRCRICFSVCRIATQTATVPHPQCPGYHCVQCPGNAHVARDMFQCVSNCQQHQQCCIGSESHGAADGVLLHYMLQHMSQCVLQNRLQCVLQCQQLVLWYHRF